MKLHSAEKWLLLPLLALAGLLSSASALELKKEPT